MDYETILVALGKEKDFEHTMDGVIDACKASQCGQVPSHPCRRWYLVKKTLEAEDGETAIMAAKRVMEELEVFPSRRLTTSNSLISPSPKTIDELEGGDEGITEEDKS